MNCFFAEAAKTGTDGSGKSSIFGDNVMDSIQLFEILEVRFNQRKTGHGTRENHRAGVTALAGEDRHSTDCLQDQIDDTCRQICNRRLFRFKIRTIHNGLL